MLDRVKDELEILGNDSAGKNRIRDLYHFAEINEYGNDWKKIKYERLKAQDDLR